MPNPFDLLSDMTEGGSDKNAEKHSAKATKTKQAEKPARLQPAPEKARPSREKDHHESGTGVRKNAEKKAGAGKGNWGKDATTSKDAEAVLEDENAAVEAVAASVEEEKRDEEAEAAAAAAAAAEAEKLARQMTLAQYEASLKKDPVVPLPALRKAGEGDANNQGELVALKKETFDLGPAVPKGKSKGKEKKRSKAEVVNPADIFRVSQKKTHDDEPRERSDRSPRGGRGGRGGAFGSPRGGDRRQGDDNREGGDDRDGADRRGGDKGARGGSRGGRGGDRGGRGGDRGARGGSPRGGDNNRRRDAPPKFTEEAFPAL